MASPDKSVSLEIDLFPVDQASPAPAEVCLPPLVCLGQPVRRQRYHSIQLAVVTGLFACGGLICSLLMVDNSADSPRVHHWLRKSSPALVAPQKPATRADLPQSVPLKSDRSDKTAALHQHGTRQSASSLALASARSAFRQ
jgi:hypothetical protein